MSAITEQEISAPIQPVTPASVLINRPPRPMLARDADAMYWMSRYVERSEHVARLLQVNANLLIDVGDLAPSMQNRLWQNILTILRLPDLPEDPDQPIGWTVQKSLTFDAKNPNSLYSCLSRARENARGIRENISSEMWEMCIRDRIWAWWAKSAASTPASCNCSFRLIPSPASPPSRATRQEGD